MQCSIEGPVGDSIVSAKSKASLKARREAVSVGEMMEILQCPIFLAMCLTSKSKPAKPSMKDSTGQLALTCVEDQMGEGVTKTTTSGRCAAKTAAVVAKTLVTGPRGSVGEQDTRTVRTSAAAKSSMQKCGSAAADAEIDQRCTACMVASESVEKNSLPMDALTKEREKPAQG